MSDYRKMSIGQKRAVAAARAREAPVRCPLCDVEVMPADLAAHQAARCARELPAPHPAARWLPRVKALAYCSGPRLDEWVERGLVRQRVDGAVLERDLAVVVAWARALEAL